MASIFTRIVRGEIPSHKVLEDESYLAFLDINPLKEGHTLVIPKKETDYIFDLDDDALAGLHVFAKKVAVALGKAYPEAERVGVAVLGMEVPHAHVHLVPIKTESDISFANPKLRLSQEQLAQVAEKIKSHL